MFKLILFDFDGCFTDGSLRDPQVNAKDTWALKKLQDLGIQTAIITRSKSVKNHLILERVGEVIYSEDKSKTLDLLLEKFGLMEDEVAYIGDDELDIPVLKRVGFSAAPADSIPSVKEIVNFVTKSNGGRGAIREFVEKCIQLNDWRNKKIVAIIGARGGSTRCPNKNGRDFGFQDNLIAKKLRVLEEVRNIDKIIFTTELEVYKEIARNFKKCIVYDRPQVLSETNVSGRELFEHFSSLISDEEALLYSPVVSPFVRTDTFEKLIRFWKFENSDMRPLAVFKEQQVFLWDESKPINYDLLNAPSSQELPCHFIPSFGFCLIDKRELVRTGNVLGENPIQILVDKIQAIDIDDKFDFVTAKLLNENNIQDMKSLEEYLDKPQVQVLDCTIRDGGYRNEWRFSFEDVAKVYQAASDSGVEWFEAGFRSTLIPGKGVWFYTSEKDLHKLRASYKGKTPAKLAVMLKMGEFDVEDIPDGTAVDLFRLLVSHKDFTEESNLKIVEVSKRIKETGKLLGVNIPYAHSISPDAQSLFSALSSEGVFPDFVYLADTFGSMSTKDIVQKFWILDEMLERAYGSDFRKIKLGFHAHNNAGDALLKTLYAVEKVHRLAVVDSCFAGLGRGVGNVRTEELLAQLNKRGAEYEERSVLKTVFEMFEGERSRIVYLVAGEKGIHPNKAIEYINKKVSFDEIV